MSISKMHLSPKRVIKCCLIPCIFLINSCPQPSKPSTKKPHKLTHTQLFSFFFFADGHIMHNQANKTADFRLECWTASRTLLDGSSTVLARCSEPTPATTNPASSPNWTEFQSKKHWSEEMLDSLQQGNGFAWCHAYIR